MLSACGLSACSKAGATTGGAMNFLENWIMPARCVLTDEPGENMDLSAEVKRSLKTPALICPQCAEFSVDGEVCGQCMVSPPAFNRTRTPYYLAGDMLDLIHGLKYGKQIAYARILAQLFLEKLDDCQVEAVLPVPIHDKRWRNRGFNQAELIATDLAKSLQLPLLSSAVSRVKDTPSQTGLTKTERQQNLRSAFAVKPAMFEKYQRIALIDDVITTSATLQSLAKQIKQKTSVDYIEAWAIAKTPLD